MTGWLVVLVGFATIIALVMISPVLAMLFGVAYGLFTNV